MSATGILKNSNDPIQLKKVYLKTWTYKDYLEVFVRDYLQRTELELLTPEEVAQLFDQYNNEAKILEHFPGILEDFSLPPMIPQTEFRNEYGEIITAEEAKKLNGEDQNLDAIPLRLKLDPEMVSVGKTFVSDINMEQISFFSVLPYMLGQAIMLEFQVPSGFILSAEVLFCENYNFYSRIISEVRPRYRIHAAFTYTWYGERILLRNFLRSITLELKESLEGA